VTADEQAAIPLTRDPDQCWNVHKGHAFGEEEAVKGQRKLSKQEVQRLTKRFTRIGQQGIENSDPAFLEALNQEVQVDLPTGELFNPNLVPLVRFWVLQGRPIVHGEITSRHQFNAQGLEGLISIRMPLSMALLTTLKADPYRSEIFLLTSPKNFSALQLGAAEESNEEDEEDFPRTSE
jgi:hypothetical protein